MSLEMWTSSLPLTLGGTFSEEVGPTCSCSLRVWVLSDSVLGVWTWRALWKQVTCAFFSFAPPPLSPPPKRKAVVCVDILLAVRIQSGDFWKMFEVVQLTYPSEGRGTAGVSAGSLHSFPCLLTCFFTSSCRGTETTGRSWVPQYRLSGFLSQTCPGS